MEAWANVHLASASQRLWLVLPGRWKWSLVSGLGDSRALLFVSPFLRD